MNGSKRRRMTTGLLTLVALTIFAGSVPSRADAQGMTWQQLDAHGWTCFVPPPVPDQVACFNPGQRRPVPGDPDARPSFTVLQFDSSGEFLFTVHLIRADLYRGQPCGPGGEPYRFIALIGYYECAHP